MALNRRNESSTLATQAAAGLDAFLGPGCEFEGKLTFHGRVRIEGKFDGQISTDDVLMVAEGARVTAEVACGSLISSGEVIGNVRAAQEVELHGPARVKGNIQTPSLIIERGVIFEGQSRMDGIEGPSRDAKVTLLAPASGEEGDDED